MIKGEKELRNTKPNLTMQQLNSLVIKVKGKEKSKEGFRDWTTEMAIKQTEGCVGWFLLGVHREREGGERCTCGGPPLSSPLMSLGHYPTHNVVEDREM